MNVEWHGKHEWARHKQAQAERWTQMDAPWWGCVYTRWQQQQWRQREKVLWPKLAPLAPHPIAPSHHLNPSVPCPDRVSSTQNWACLHFAGQNRAPVAQFLVFWPKPTPLVLRLIMPSHHLNPSVYHPNRVASTQNRAHPHFANQNRASAVCTLWNPSSVVVNLFLTYFMVGFFQSPTLWIME